VHRDAAMMRPLAGLSRERESVRETLSAQQRCSLLGRQLVGAGGHLFRRHADAAIPMPFPMAPSRGMVGTEWSHERSGCSHSCREGGVWRCSPRAPEHVVRAYGEYGGRERVIVSLLF
jgi:hypothetical protein